MRLSLGHLGLPACESTAQASWTGCIVVPGVTKGTLTTENQMISNIVAGQVVDYTPQNLQAFTQNTGAAGSAGQAIFASADPGAVNRVAVEAPEAVGGGNGAVIAIGILVGVLILGKLL